MFMMWLNFVFIILGCFFAMIIHAGINLRYKEKIIRKEYNIACEKAIDLSHYLGDMRNADEIKEEVKDEFRKIYKGYYIEHLFEDV